MTTVDTDAFAAEWVAAWNAHDLERVLSHYADDVVMRTPIAARVKPESGGILVGKAALADYWGAALPLFPDLHFTLDQALASQDALTILYRNQRNQLVAESVVFGEDGLVVSSMAAYAPVG